MRLLRTVFPLLPVASPAVEARAPAQPVCPREYYPTGSAMTLLGGVLGPATPTMPPPGPRWHGHCTTLTPTLTLTLALISLKIVCLRVISGAVGAQLFYAGMRVAAPYAIVVPKVYTPWVSKQLGKGLVLQAACCRVR